jgi:hypothetical protein
MIKLKAEKKTSAKDPRKKNKKGLKWKTKHIRNCNRMTKLKKKTYKNKTGN